MFAFPRKRAAKDLKVLSLIWRICSSSDLRIPVAIGITANRCMAVNRLEESSVTILASDFNRLSLYSRPAN